MARYDLTDFEWSVIEPLLPQKSREVASAIRYALTRMKRLRPYLKNGFLELDNNTAERSMRPIALGRRNYLFMALNAVANQQPSPIP